MKASIFIGLFVIASASGAEAQGLRNRTIQVVYTSDGTACNLASGRCAEIRMSSGNTNIYVSSEGRVFDYAAGDRGTVTASNESFVSSSGQTQRWTVGANKLTLRTLGPTVESVDEYILTGPTSCRMTRSTRALDGKTRFQIRLNVSKCEVHQGRLSR